MLGVSSSQVEEGRCLTDVFLGQVEADIHDSLLNLFVGTFTGVLPILFVCEDDRFPARWDGSRADRPLHIDCEWDRD